MARKISLKLTMQELTQVPWVKDDEGWFNAVYCDFVMSTLHIKSATLDKHIWLVTRMSKAEDGRTIGKRLAYGDESTEAMARVHCKRTVRSTIAREIGGLEVVYEEEFNLEEVPCAEPGQEREHGSAGGDVPAGGEHPDEAGAVLDPPEGGEAVRGE